MKGEVATILIAAALVIGAGIGYFSNTTATGTTTETVVRTHTSTVTVLQGTSTLDLLASETPQVAYEGQNVSITTELFNQSPAQVVINGTEITDPSDSPCGLGIRPVGIDIYFGTYDLGNVSGVKPLTLYNASLAVPCFVTYGYEYTFQPHSDNASVSYLSTSASVLVNYTDRFSGSWYSCGDTAGPCSGFQFSHFQPGPYTIRVFDAWGGQAILHFEVLDTNGPASAYSCPVPYTGVDSKYTNSSAVEAFPIISVSKGRSVVLCVTYYDNNPNKNESVSMTGSISIGTIEAMPNSGCSPSPCTSYSFASSSKFRISDNISGFILGAGHASHVTVGYMITPTGDQPGFYWLNIGALAPFSCAVEFPFAYGYTFTGSNSSGQYFPLPSGYFAGCITYNSNYYSEYAYAYLTAVSNDTSIVPLNCGGYSCDVSQT